jgi:O-antigen/teichoic acid export membrane protein
MPITKEETRPLTERTATALAWRFAAKFAAFGLRLGCMIALARLVSVEAFGVIGQATIFTGLIAESCDLGMAAALVQHRQLTKALIRVAFTVSVLGGMLLTLAAWAGAPLAAAVSHMPDVCPVLRALSLTFLLTTLGITAEGLLQRALAYRRLFTVDLVSYGVGYGAVGIPLAFLGYGVWALTWAMIIETLLRTMLLYLAAPHSLWPSLARTELRQLFRFGSGLTLVRLCNYAAIAGDNFVVGRRLGETALGLYGRAYQVMTLPMTEFSEVVSGVLFPAYAEIQNDSERLRRASLASVALTSLVVFPALAMLAIAAPELIGVVLGPSWAGAVLPLQILCIGGVFRSIYNLGDSIARARGAVYAQSWRHAVYAVCIIGGAILGSRWGIEGVAVGVVVALIVMYLLMAQLTIHLIEANWRMFWWAQWPGLILTTAVVAIAWPLTNAARAGQLPPLLILAGAVTSSVTVALVVGLLLPRRWHNEAIVDAVRMVEDRYASVRTLSTLCWRRDGSLSKPELSGPIPRH